MHIYNIKKGNIVRWSDPDEGEASGMYRASSSYAGDDDYGVVAIEDKESGEFIAEVYTFELEVFA